MKEDENIIEETIKIPMDMMMDILTIIVKEHLTHEIVKVISNRSLVVVVLTYDKTAPKIQKVIYNIQNLLSNYQDYRSWENEEINWREKLMERICEYCKNPFEPKRADALYCSHSCRQLAYVLRKATGNTIED